ncbi:glycerate kinase [Macrococcus hajekii]|uniref:Glycerate kinase n=1 Tax=Macrococcus hajekii TaxID=198482 RepID=A0A4R6BIL2_9STAP|nr:glycerate kinase [Macrococcus hajekii]TDM01483.1 glycerate kinase [Macrococcus hajekii]GGB00328.1 glycerate kinase [Macrococcus hajekii]
MNILIAMDRFEDILTSSEAASYVEEGARVVWSDAQIISVPLFDGQKNLIEGILSWQQGTKYRWQIPDANMEMRQVTAAGVNEHFYIDCTPLYGQTRDLMKTSSYGLGEMILHALDLDYRTFTIALGEAALYDGGIGMLQQLGAQFFDLNDDMMTGPLDSESIKRVRRIDLSHLDDRLTVSSFNIISDYDYYLFGNNSSVVNEALTDADKSRLDNNIWYLNEQYKKSGLHLALQKGGHAGGLRGLFESLFKARTHSSKEMIFEETSIVELLSEADVIIYGGGTATPMATSLVAQAITEQVTSDKRYIYLAAGQQTAPANESVYYLNIYPNLTGDVEVMDIGVQLLNSVQTLLKMAK